MIYLNNSEKIVIIDIHILQIVILRIIVFCLRYLSFVVVAFIYWNLHTFAYVSALHIKNPEKASKV